MSLGMSRCWQDAGLLQVGVDTVLMRLCHVQIWLTLAMSMLLIVPAAGVGAWFGGLFPVSPHRTS